jgi:CRP-like cAMP-binding protein
MQHSSLSATVNFDQELRKTHLFAGLDETQLALLKQTMRQWLLQPGETLFEHGQPAQRFFLLREGHIKLIRISIEGIEKIFEIVSPGETFAEAVMFMPTATYPVTAIALMPSNLLSFENKVFMEILKESPSTCFRLMFEMSRRIRLWLNEIDQLTLQNATYRLINYLLYHLPAEHSNVCQIQFPLPKQVIASRLSIKPETLSRILNCLNQQGLITVEGKTIYIHDVHKLQLYNPQEKCLF